MITTTYFCAICQDPFHGESAKGGRRFCARHRQHAGKSVRSLLLHIADQEHKLELRDADNAALTKRVAELEAQLAWTPVSARLPEVDRTTRAVLVVRDAHGGAMLLEPRQSDDLAWKWCNPEFPFGIQFGAGCTWEYRRIELPEATEYHAQGDVPKAVLNIVQEQYSKRPKGGES